MTDLQLIIVYSLLCGATVLLGGILSHFFGDRVKAGLVKDEIIHLSMAFGGGILIAAVGLVLVPEGMRALTLVPTAICFSAGSVFFFFVDRYMDKRGGTMAQLLSMLSDFVPEAIAMGAVFSSNQSLGILLAVIIGIQNLSKSFNAYMDLKTRYTIQKSSFILFLLSLTGVISALAGYYLLAKPMMVGGLMLFSSGGIVCLIFQDIAPMSKLKKKGIPALGASLGFMMGMIGVDVLG
ncbi:MAG: ZIP family zinc transporter [Roseivirga sp.]|jgi:ZIP family zinc transporter